MSSCFIYLSFVYLKVCLFCIPVYLYACLFAYMSVCLFLFVSFLRYILKYLSSVSNYALFICSSCIPTPFRSSFLFVYLSIWMFLCLFFVYLPVCLCVCLFLLSYLLMSLLSFMTCLTLLCSLYGMYLSVSSLLCLSPSLLFEYTCLFLPFYISTYSWMRKERILLCDRSTERRRRRPSPPQKLILYCIVPPCLNPTLPTSRKKATLFTLVVLLSSKPSYFKIARSFVRSFFWAQTLIVLNRSFVRLFIWSSSKPS
jgi:hypothetical protein